MSETRKPVRFANYNADVRDIVGQIKGPNAYGELFTALTADYDPDTGRTRVGFAFTTTQDVERVRQEQVRQLTCQVAFTELFEAPVLAGEVKP